LVKEKQNLVASSRKNALDAIKVQTADHDSKIRKAEKKCKEHESARSIALRAKEDAIEAAEKMEAVVVKAKQKAQKQKDRVNDWTRQATEHCPRVSIKPGDTVASLEAKLEKVRQKLLLYTAKLGGSEEEITAAAEAATEKYRLAREQYQDLIDLLNLLKQTYAKRLDMWRKFQRHISARSRIGFTYLLSERGFRGKLTIDHKSKLLDLKVEPDETTKSSKGRQAKTLSGGEKSFSNICLLLALWEAMGAPLRCLDEFDVFMDQVNRDISTTMIVSVYLSHSLHITDKCVDWCGP
jgi:chromosome segregation ATPase